MRLVLKKGEGEPRNPAKKVLRKWLCVGRTTDCGSGSPSFLNGTLVKACLWCSHFITFLLMCLCFLFVNVLDVHFLFLSFFFLAYRHFHLFHTKANVDLAVPNLQCLIYNTQHINTKDDLARALHFHALRSMLVQLWLIICLASFRARKVLCVKFLSK